MKKGMSILMVLLLGVSVKSYAATGNASDGLEFFLVFAGILLIILALLYGVDYLQKNGKTMISQVVSFLKKKMTLLKAYLNKVKSNHFDPSYF